MMIHPKEGDDKKTDDIGDKVGDLLEQVGSKLGGCDSGNLRNLKIQHEQREGNRVYAVRDGAQSIMRVCTFEKQMQFSHTQFSDGAAQWSGFQIRHGEEAHATDMSQNRLRNDYGPSHCREV